nr:hypothetical protein [Cereibacter changlensis]
MRLERLPAGVEGDHLVLHLVGRHAGNDGLDQSGVVARDLGQFLLQTGPASGGRRLQPVALFGVGQAEGLDQVRVHQVMLEGGQHRGLEIRPADGEHVGADCAALVARRGAAEALLRYLGEATPAAAAGHQARQQELRPTPVPDRRVGALHLQVALALARRLPKGVIDDPQRRHLGHLPRALVVQSRDALAAARLLHIGQSVPDLDAGIELVVQDPGAVARQSV